MKKADPDWPVVVDLELDVLDTAEGTIPPGVEREPNADDLERLKKDFSRQRAASALRAAAQRLAIVQPSSQPPTEDRVTDEHALLELPVIRTDDRVGLRKG